jgi:hypothetical protein
MELLILSFKRNIETVHVIWQLINWLLGSLLIRSLYVLYVVRNVVRLCNHSQRQG